MRRLSGLKAWIVLRGGIVTLVQTTTAGEWYLLTIVQLTEICPLKAQHTQQDSRHQFAGDNDVVPYVRLVRDRIVEIDPSVDDTVTGLDHGRQSLFGEISRHYPVLSDIFIDLVAK